MEVKSSSSENLDCRSKVSAEPKMKLRKMKSVRLSKVPSLKQSTRRARSRFDSTLQDLSAAELSDPSPDHMKTTSFSTSKKEGEMDDISVSSFTSRSSGSTQSCANQDGKIKGKIGLEKKLKKSKYKTGLKSERPSTKMNSEFSQDSSVNRATCSSALKGLKSPEHVELYPEENESKRISVIKVCSYHHCSLNGHSHVHDAPRKPFSSRRYSFKNKKDIKAKSSFPFATKQSDDKKGEFQTSHLVHNVKPEVGDQSIVSPPISSNTDDKEVDCSVQIYAVPKAQFFRGAIGEFKNRESTKNDMILSTSNGHPNKEPKATRVEKNSTHHPDTEASTPIASLDARRIIKIEDSQMIHEAQKPLLKKERHISMWNLIHQHVVSGLSEEAGAQPLQGPAQNKQVDDANISPTTRSRGPGFSVSSENSDVANEEIELRKVFAIKLVREAIEKILLPEVSDQCSDDLSITSEAISEQELEEKNHGELGKQNGSAFADSCNNRSKESDNSKGDDNALDDPKSAGARSAADNFSAQEEETATKAESKTEKQAPKRWSRLKKLILLKRFVKELEKVRKFNPRKPHNLPSEPDSEAEKVSLRRQVTNEKKSAEEWMLDYALRQVVSQLAPSQKRKVALLVQAFETVVPPQEDQHIQVTPTKLKDNSNGCSSTGSEEDEFVSEVTNIGPDPRVIGIPKFDSIASNSTMHDKQYDTTNHPIFVIHNSQLHSNHVLSSDENVDNSIEHVPVDESALHVQRETTFSLNSKLLNGDPESSKSDPEPVTREVELHSLNKTSHPTDTNYDGQSRANDDIVPTSNLPDRDRVGQSRAIDDIVPTASNCDLREQVTAATEEKSREFPPEHIIFQKSEPDSRHKGAYKTKLDKQNYVKMWHVIYQHVATGIAAKVGGQLLIDGDDEQIDDKNSAGNLEASDCHHENFNRESEIGKHNDTSKENSEARLKGIEFSRSDAVRLVQEAVDEILLPDIQDDSSDAQSIASDITTDQELFENKNTDGGEQNISTSTASATGRNGVHDINETEVVDPVKEAAADNIATLKEERAEPIIRIKSKNWSKLKKLILLKRFYKALEKARKQSTHTPPAKPSMPDTEAERIDLRRQMMDERKKAEQWMLDYAVQHIVTKLTPARKQRVAMLVEAFEAVVPLPDI